jgi:hypothetical protein
MSILSESVHLGVETIIGQDAADVGGRPTSGRGGSGHIILPVELISFELMIKINYLPEWLYF